LYGWLDVSALLSSQVRGADRERQGMLLLAVAAWVLAPLAARRFLGPVRDLIAAARAVMRGEFAVALPETRADEFGQLAVAFNSMVQGVREGRLLRSFVSDSVRARAGDATRIGAGRSGEAVAVSVLFAGLQGFKNRLGSRPPEVLIHELNDHLAAMAAVVQQHGGQIDKFIGDKLLAVFDPRELGGAAAAATAALAAARAMGAGVPRSALGRECALGVGVASGAVLAGILGAEAVRFEYTVIGDTVNLASRLADAAQNRSGGGIVLDGATAALLDTGTRAELVALGALQVKGKARSVETWRVR